MPEMPNVIASEEIEVEWGNDIRDRTIQRYATAAARAAAHAAPTAGDLSYLADTDGVYVWNGTAWVVLVPAGSVPGSALAGVAISEFVKGGGDVEKASVAITASFADRAAVTFTKPAAWGNYFIMAWGSCAASAGGGSLLSRVEIGASNGLSMEGSSTSCFHQVASSSASPIVVALACAEAVAGVVVESSTITYLAIRLS